MKLPLSVFAACLISLSGPGIAYADPVIFSTGNVDGRMAAGSRPSASGKTEIEAADDFVLSTETNINTATFTGLLSGATAAITGGGVSSWRSTFWQWPEMPMLSIARKAELRDQMGLTNETDQIRTVDQP